MLSRGLLFAYVGDCAAAVASRWLLFCAVIFFEIKYLGVERMEAMARRFTRPQKSSKAYVHVARG